MYPGIQKDLTEGKVLLEWDHSKGKAPAPLLKVNLNLNNIIAGKICKRKKESQDHELLNCIWQNSSWLYEGVELYKGRSLKHS
jgi:hypothetical protein